MQFGRYYEEFEVGAVYRHWPGKTVTESDDHLFCLITMNHHPLHLDAHYAETATQFGRNVVVGNLIYSLLLGMSVADVSGKAIANLEVESWRPRRHSPTPPGTPSTRASPGSTRSRRDVPRPAGWFARSWPPSTTNPTRTGRSPRSSRTGRPASPRYWPNAATPGGCSPSGR